MSRCIQILGVFLLVFLFSSCDRLKNAESEETPGRKFSFAPPVKEDADPDSQDRGKAEGGEDTSAPGTETQAEEGTEGTPPQAAEEPEPVPYDPVRDIGLALSDIAEMRRLLAQGRFTQMRAYLDELYLLVGYLEARQPQSIVRLTVSRVTHLIVNDDLQGAANEVARAQQELARMPNGQTAAELSTLLDPVRSALVRGSAKTAMRALSDIHIKDSPDDFSSVAREIRQLLASVDLDLARQSARVLEIDLAELEEAFNRLSNTIKSASSTDATAKKPDLTPPSAPSGASKQATTPPTPAGASKTGVTSPTTPPSVAPGKPQGAKPLPMPTVKPNGSNRGQQPIPQTPAKKPPTSQPAKAQGKSP